MKEERIDRDRFFITVTIITYNNFIIFTKNMLTISKFYIWFGGNHVKFHTSPNDVNFFGYKDISLIVAD